MPGRRIPEAGAVQVWRTPERSEGGSDCWGRGRADEGRSDCWGSLRDCAAIAQTKAGAIDGAGGRG